MLALTEALPICNAGFLREQVCKYMCPYARFQGAMFDRDTLIIAYDPMRGEPRGPRKRTLKDVFTRARGLLDVATAYDYVFRATRHPSAADNSLQAAGTIVLGDVNAEAKPLPTFAPEELGARSEARRGGEESVRTCRTRGAR